MRQTLLLSLLAFLWTLPDSPAVAQPKPPRPTPRLNLLELCRGKVTVIAFVVTGCPHCKAFTRDVLEPLYESRRICAVAIAFDEDADTARFSREQKLTFPVFKLDRKVVREFLGIPGEDRALGTPQVVVIDRAGIIQAQSAAAGSPLLLQPAILRDLIERLP
jgi:peroxiredoxin